MPNYMLAYYGGKQPASKEEGLAHMHQWQEWIKSLGEQMVNPGTPLINSFLVTQKTEKKDEDSYAMKGFAVLSAKDMEEAKAIAKTDPFLATEGTIRVSEMKEMK